MFGESTLIYDDANCLTFNWTYIVKEYNSKKAHGFYNGSPHMKCTLVLSEIYAASLDQTLAKICWAIEAAKGNIVLGKYTPDVFTEASASYAPLYI